MTETLHAGSASPTELEPALQDSPPRRAATWRMNRIAIALIALLALGVIVDVAAPVLLPVLLSAFVALLLNPVVRGLARIGVPRALAAGLILGSLIGGVGGIGYAVHAPALEAIEQSPQVIDELKRRIQRMTQPVLAAGKVSEALQAIESIGAAPAPRRVEVVRPHSALSERFGGVLVVAASLGATLVLVYLFLVFGESLFRRAVTIAPTLREKRTTVAIVRSVQSEISRYVSTVTLVNLMLGAATAAILNLLGVRDALLWGLMAALLNFIPYLGPLICALILAAVGLLQFDSLGAALLPTASYMCLNLLEGQLLTPLLLGRTFSVNPVVIVLWLLLWGWLWGALGLLLAMPLLVCTKIVLDHSESLRPWAQIMER